jgi:hypothetical protein
LDSKVLLRPEILRDLVLSFLFFQLRIGSRLYRLY